MQIYKKEFLFFNINIIYIIESEKNFYKNSFRNNPFKILYRCPQHSYNIYNKY